MTIRNDATRQRLRTRDPRTPRAVVPRQGQALLDADLDQQARHTLTRIEAETADILGSLGRLVVPGGSTAFAVSPAAAPASPGIGAGRGYLGGWLVESPAPGCTLSTQPHPRTDAPSTGPAALVLKVLVRHVDPVEETGYADPALGDAQAAGRSLVDWQVFPFAPSGSWASPSCATVTSHADYLKMVAPSTGTLAVVPDTAPPAADPCTLAPAGGYSRSENLCYRIEVDGGVARGDFPTADGPRFGLNGLRVKLSRRNASVMVRIVSVSGTEVTVEPQLLDPENWFAPGMHAELVSPHDDVDPRDAIAGPRLFQVARATDTVVTLAASAAASLANKTGWFLRLWDAFPDGAGTKTVNTTTAAPNVSPFIDLGDGLKIRLGAGPGGAAGATFRRGDHWTFAARSDGTIDWPAGNVFEAPHGPETRYAPLAVLTGTPAVAEDCRIPAATLTDRVLLYRGGDGQSVPAPAGGGFVSLPSSLRVAVMRGKNPVVGARLRWSVPTNPSTPSSRVNGQNVGGGATVDVTTDSNGTCSVAWAIDSAAPLSAHRVQVSLLDASGNPDGAALVFTGQFATAGGTSYQPGACADLSGAATVQEALDVLCQRPTGDGGTGCCASVGRDGDYERIEDAIHDLAERHKGEVCICLLPGDHSYEHDPIDFVRRLDIHGCGARLHLETPFEVIKAEAVELADLEIVGSEKLEEHLIRLEAVGDVGLEGLTVGAHGPDTSTLVHLLDCGDTRVDDCTLAATELVAQDARPRFTDVAADLLGAVRDDDSRALEKLTVHNRESDLSARRLPAAQLEEFASSPVGVTNPRLARAAAMAAALIRAGAGPDRFAHIRRELKDVAEHLDSKSGIPRAALSVEQPRGPVWVRGNRMAGGLSLYGVATPERIHELDNRLDDIIGEAEDPQSFESGTLRLEVSGNILAWTLLAHDPKSLPEVFGVAAFSGNQLRGGPAELAARHVTFTGNDLDRGEARLAGLVHSNKVSATTNVGTGREPVLVLSSGIRVEAANADLIIEP